MSKISEGRNKASLNISSKMKQVPQVHLGSDDEGEGEVELLVRHSAVLRPVEVTGSGHVTHVWKVSRQLSIILLHNKNNIIKIYVM